MNMYVGNLPYSVTEEELRNIFTPFGEVSSVNLITDKFSGQSRGFGFVEMPNNADADKAIKALNDKTYSGRKMKVNQARPRGERPPQGNNRQPQRNKSW
ncbi:MAG: RNA-binding protein [Gammaproteobacteria bacterium]|nr:RNA-binding protein [Gammaproteobacteria bacterium]MDD9823866.1 RNA-binding protein [Gammaproteobacteria bacterium]MDD9864285.1 RNA-binding protein [Gammaproteobacteria bacterium]